MSEVLTLNTESGIVKEEEILPLQVLDENFPGLRSKLPEVDVTALPNGVITNLVKRMKMTMKLYNGLGLSANQCGIMERIFVIGTDQFQIACINPKIISSKAEVAKEKEGCLSFPGLSLIIERPKSIEVEFYTENGELKQMTLDGLTARCFQHELDHLNGVRMTEHVKPLALAMARKKQSKLIKQYVRRLK